MSTQFLVFIELKIGYIGSLGMLSFLDKSEALREYREDVGETKMEEEKDQKLEKSKATIRCRFRHCLNSFSFKGLSKNLIY